MKQTVVEWLYDQMNNIKGSSISMNGSVQFIEKELNNLFKQAKAMERSQKAEEYLKGFKDGKKYQIKLDELTFGSSKQIMSTDIPFTNKDIDEMMEILNRMQKKLTFKSE